MTEQVDIAIIGAGAAGIMAAIWAGRTLQEQGGAQRFSIAALDSARRLGAKILIAGGGRCNVTHDVVEESAYAGSSRELIGRVLRRFDVPRTIAFFRDLGVELKREETGKLFPVSDDARTVLDALLCAATDAGTVLRHPFRVSTVECTGVGFTICGGNGDGGGGEMLHAQRLILATGGMALPRTGSDGHGYSIARSLGHSITPRLFPGLVPLTLPKDHFICGLSGVSARVTLEVRAHSGKRLASFTNSMLCAHFGISGPCTLDISRYYTDALREAQETGNRPPQLVVNWLPLNTPESLDRRMIEWSRTHGQSGVGGLLRAGSGIDTHAPLPDRLIDALCRHAGITPGTPVVSLSREQRLALVRAMTNLVLPITGDRGHAHAEVTAGGVPLWELNVKAMESRFTPGLYLCGEICDVDGRVGGFNFQWAWASGHVAGCAAAESLRQA